jgi:FkbM family methyltransferase
MKRILFGENADWRRVRFLPEIAMEFRDVPKEDIDAALEGLDEPSKKAFWTFLSRSFFPTMKNTQGVFDRTPRHFFIGSGLSSEAECQKWDALLQKESTLKAHYLTHPTPSDFTFTLRHGLPLLPDAALSYMHGKIFVDGGAFVGDSSLVFGDYGPSEIWAFEPSPHNQRLFLDTMQHNHVSMEHIKLIPKGLSDKAGEIRFTDTAGSDCSLTEKGTSIAQLTPLDALTVGVKVGFIKTDLEGMGLVMLRGAQETILRDRPVLSLAIYHNKEEMLGTYAFLKSLRIGYRYRMLQMAPPWEWRELCLLAWPEEFGELRTDNP